MNAKLKVKYLFTDAMAWSVFGFALSRAARRSKSNARRRQMALIRTYEIHEWPLRLPDIINLAWG
jgi:hypothetical protein